MFNYTSNYDKMKVAGQRQIQKFQKKAGSNKL